jgi:MFS family permease
MQSSASEIEGTGRGDREGRAIHLGRLTLAGCLLFWLFVFCDSGWGPVLVPLSAQMHISLNTAGLLYVSWSTGYLPGALVGGAMLDRFGPRHVLFGASLIVLSGISVIFLGLFVPQVVSIWFLLAIAGLAGSGGGVIDAGTNGMISAVYAEKRGMALNLFNVLYPLGGVLVALIDAGLLRLFQNDPRPAFLFTVCYIVIAMFSLPFIPKKYMIGPGKSKAIDGTQDVIKQAPTLLATLAPVIAVMIFLAGISSSLRAWTPSYLHIAYTQTPAIAAALSSITWVLATLSRVVAAVLIARIGSWRIVMLGIIITLIGLVTVILSPNAILATMAIALASFGLSPIFATCLVIGSELAGRSLGSVAGILLFAAGISTVFCGWFFGFLLNSIGPLWSIGFCITFIVLGGLMALRLRPARTQ